MSAAAKESRILELSKPKATALVSPFWDCFFVGGLGLGVYLLVSITSLRVAPDLAIATFVYQLSFLVNFPHFLVSYQLLYGDFRREIGRSWRYFWAAVCVPLLLGCGLVTALYLRNGEMLGYFFTAMYFSVGWHYSRQTFGVMVVTGAMRKVYFTPIERAWLVGNMYMVWILSFVSMNIGERTMTEMGVVYRSLNFPEWWRYACYGGLVLCTGGVIVTQLQKFIREGVNIPASAWTAYVASYVLLVPSFSHPFFTHMVPLFHSLQYLLFVYVFRRNVVNAEIAEPNSPEGRRKWFFGIWGYLGLSVILGALFFHLIPGILDGLRVLDPALYGFSPFVFAFTIFLNIHHYFIDNAIWRSDNAEIRRHLFHG